MNATTGAITFQDVITNTGNATAYGATLNDPEAAINAGAITGLTATGAANGAAGIGAASFSVSGGTAVVGSFSLAPGASETITYTVAVADRTAALPNSTATVNWRSLKGDTQTAFGTSTGAIGSATGARTEPGLPVGAALAVNTYTTSVTLGFGALSGRLWDELGPFNTTYNLGGDIDTALTGVTVSATGLDPNTGGAKTVTTATDVNGQYVFSPGIFGNGAVTITLPSPGTGGLGATETLVYNALGAVTSNPATANATIAIGTANTGLNFIYQRPDVAPVISGWGGTNIAETGSAPVLLKGVGAGIVSTPINTLGGNYLGTVLTVQRTGGANATDVFTGDGTLTLSSGAVTLSSVQIGTFTQTGGALAITFNTAATITAAQVAGVMDHLQYANTNANALQNGVSITAVLNDHNTTSYATAPGQTSSPGFNLGTGGALNSNAVVATINITPATSTVTFTKPNDIAPATNAVALNSTLTVGSAPDSVALAITAGFRTGEDVLGVANTDLGATLQGSFNATTGVLTITAVAGQTPTAADWQTALRGVKFVDTNPIPNLPARTVTVSYTTGAVVTSSTETVNVVDLDSSPILGAGAATLGSTNTLSTAAPTGAVGTLVSALLSQVGVTDPDGDSQTNGGTPATGGLSVVAVDTTKGVWWYSTNAGASWTQFAGGVLPVISATNGLHLVGDANTRIYFQPNVGAAAGTTATALTFRAWDQYNAVGNGTLSAIPADGTLGGPSATGPNALAFSYSSTIAVVPIVLFTPGGAVSGRTWDRLGPAASVAFGAPGDVDTALAGVTVSASGPKPDGSPGTLTATTTTDLNGNYSFAAGTFGAGTVTVSMPSAGAGGLPATETLVYDAFGTVPANPGTASVTLGTGGTTGVNFIYQQPDVAPVLAGWGGTNVQVTGTAPVSLAGLGASIVDTPLNTLGGGGGADYGGTFLTVGRTGGPNTADIFSGDGTLSLASGVVKLGVTTVGGFTQTSGVLVVTFATGTTAIQVAAVLDHLHYANSNGNLVQNAISISAILNDHNTTSYAAAPGNIAGSPGFNLGTGGALNSNAVIATINVVPAAVTVTFTKPNDIAPDTNAVALDSTLTVATAPDTVTLAITVGFRTGEDVLGVSNTDLGATLQANYNVTTGVLTITKVVGQTPTAADWQTALRGVKFVDTNPIPNLPARTVTTTYTTGAVATTSTETINVVDLDSSPILGAGVANLGNAGIFAYAPPAGVAGTLVSALLTTVGVTDPDGASQTNGGAPATGGLSVVAVDITKGSWWYSTNAGATWTQFAGGGQSAISATNALHLVGDANTRVYFQPNVGASAGTLPTALTFRAWDQYNAVGNGTLSAIPTDGVLGGPSATGPNALAFSYSSTTAVVPITLVAPTGAVSGRVWDTLGAANLAFNPPTEVDNSLAGITVTATFTDALNVVRTVITTTAIDGTYSFAAGTLPDGAVRISLPVPGSGGLAANETLVLQRIGTVGAGAAASSITLAGAAVSNVDFIYEKPDTAPVITGWGGTNVPESGSAAVALAGLGATITDAPINTLGGDYGGTILTISRTGTPVGTDVFAGSGTLTLTGGVVKLGGAPIGTFTQTGGSLVVTFDPGTTAAQAAGVLDNITYSNTAPVTVLGQTASITASLNDNNTTLYTGLDPASTGRNLGVGGPLTGTAIATVALAPAGSITGRVWDVLGPANLVFGSGGDIDTALGGITVSASYVMGGIITTVTTTTAADGTYTFAAGTLPDGTITIRLPAAGSAGLGATENLVLQQFGTVAVGPATSTITLAGGPVANVNFIYEKPDIAPSLGGWGGTGIPESGRAPVALKGLGGTISDIPIDTLGGNYGGTILTLARTGGPVATDVFAASGTVVLAGGIVTVGGTDVGSFTQTGGSLVITFANGTTAAVATTVLNGLTYSNTAPVTVLGQTASITASLNDHNTTLYTGLDPASIGRNLGVGGPLTGTAIATVALAPAGSITGRVWDVLGPANLVFGTGGDIDTALGGITVSASYVVGGITTTVTTTTAADGTYTFAAGTLPDGTITIRLPAPGSAGLGTTENLVLQQFGTVGTGPATSTINLSGGPVANVNFIYEKPDVAPVIAGWGGTNIPGTGSTPVALRGLGASVSDTPIDALGGNYGGTVLTVQRTTGPNPADLFGGDTALLITGGTVTLGNTLIGVFTQSGGSLVITFANNVTAPQVASVLDHLTYANTSPDPTRLNLISIGASLNDRNTTSYGGTSPGFNLGTGGPVTSNLVIATIAITPLPPSLPILTPPPPDLPPDPIEKFGFGSGNRSLIQDRVGRPENWLVGSDVRRFIIANQRSVEPLPPDMFYDTDPSSQLTLNAVQTDGRPLPDWLIFDSRARVFYGTPPATFHGRVDIAISAVDEQGHRAQGEYRILVGRDLAALQELLQPPRVERPLPRLNVRGPVFAPLGEPAEVEGLALAAVAQTEAAPVVQAESLQNAVDPTSFFAALSQQTNTASARAGFSQQLRDAGRSGRLGQARALLRTLDLANTSRPAA